MAVETMDKDILSSVEPNAELSTIDAQTLMATDFCPPVEIIENLLYQGLYILAGSPKVGKSWLCLWLCLQIAKGEPVWGRKTLPGSVLYFCLEDTYHRLKSRVGKITGSPSANAHFAIEARDIQNGLDEQIETFIGRYPDTRVVVIDTFQMVRPVSEWGYAADYNELKIIKEIADKHNIAIIVVHHLRKMRDDNVLNVVSGSTGITGCADGVFVLSKANHSQTASLYVTGRDLEEAELSLKFNENCVFELYEKPVKQEKPVPLPPPPTAPVNTKEEMMAQIKENALILNCNTTSYNKFAKNNFTILIKKFTEANEQFEGTLGEFAVELRKLENAAGLDAHFLQSYIATYSPHLWKYEGIVITLKKLSKKGPIKVWLYSTPKETKTLLANLDKLHTTELGAVRIRRNLNLETDGVVEWCKQKIRQADEVIREGKNLYVHTEDCIITVNAGSFTIITAHN